METTTDPVAFLVLGPVQLCDGDGRRVRIGARKLGVLLAVLLARANTRVSADALVHSLWGDRPPKSATANLQTYVWELRRRLPAPGGRRLEHDVGGYRLLVERDEVDATAFGELALRGRRQLDSGAPAAAAATLGAGVALCRGEPFEGADEVAGEGPVLRLREQYWNLREDLVAARLLLGEHAAAVPDLLLLTTEQPYREWPWAQLMLALHRCGRRAEALAAHRRVYRIFSTELGIELGAELRDLPARILSADPALTAR